MTVPSYQTTFVKMLDPDNREVISAAEERKYISERYSTLTEEQIGEIMETYDYLVESGESPNPEDHFSYIAAKYTISENVVKEVFDIQFDFLVSKGLAVKN